VEAACGTVVLILKIQIDGKGFMRKHIHLRPLRSTPDGGKRSGRSTV
jgi:hypothetical protein